MNGLLPVFRPTATPRRQLGLPAGLVVTLLAASFVVPDALARDGADTGNLRASFRRGIVVAAACGNLGSHPSTVR
jgi:hypothetical protein